VHDRRHPYAFGPFAGMTDTEIADLDDGEYDARVDAYVGPDHVDTLEELAA